MFYKYNTVIDASIPYTAGPLLAWLQALEQTWTILIEHSYCHIKSLFDQETVIECTQQHYGCEEGLREQLNIIYVRGQAWVGGEVNTNTLLSQISQSQCAYSAFSLV